MATAFADSSVPDASLDTVARSAHLSFTNISARYHLPLLLLIAAIWMFRTPYSASNLEVPPDTVEYALAPAQMLETGHYQIVIQGHAWPSRYPPWFSLAVILPFYIVLGADPGNAIFGITFFAVAGVGIACAVGRKISGDAGGILAAVGLLALPTYSAWATQVMTDVPSTTLFLAGCWLFLQIRAPADSNQLAQFSAAGILVAVATLFRPISAVMLLPFTLAALTPWRFAAVWRRSACLLGPMLCAACATFAYNAATFGSPTRNGYHFWLWKTSPKFGDNFGLANLGPNTMMLLGTGFPILLGACVAGLLVLRKTRTRTRDGAMPLRDLVCFVAVGGGPMLLFHLFYFYPADRFFLPLLASTAVIAGSIIGLVLAKKYDRFAGAVLGMLLLIAGVARVIQGEPVPQRRVAADRLRENTPADAIVISTIDPVFLEDRVARGSGRRILPLSRAVEYAQRLVPTQGGGQNRYIVQFVATEQLDELVAESRRGRRTFLDATDMDEDFAEALRLINSRFRMTKRATALYELTPL